MKRLLTIGFITWTALMLPVPIHAQSYQGRNPHRHCDKLCRAKCDATWRNSRFRNLGVEACYAHWNRLNATPEKHESAKRRITLGSAVQHVDYRRMAMKGLFLISVALLFNHMGMAPHSNLANNSL
jgi:hypothetical protein